MYGALDANRLCLLSLGNKHDYGLDGVPQDLEQAYGKHLYIIMNYTLGKKILIYFSGAF